ncbi:coiled-coil domain-containing protein 94 [Anoplophora glabripennis]|uniref:coiled-coil domain-containing protein 94 n=1 Tax=Anoplophora glabripennis TaxID=217634 RepID=UPI0008742FF4|nr:coiled-coil domain-containing protein 94 [Anoplophora glabripennis]
MSERKVLNKYYPPDFDPAKIPRMKLPKNRQYTVRLMAPFNMRCATCGEYIYKGKKFNARKEDVENQDYLGIRIYRFYIKCTRCLQEISFKTDPRNTDYEIEAGATRNFMALKLAEEQAIREEEEAKEEEANNPMKLLENRTKQSKNEIELLESLEELKDLNRRQQVVDYDTMLSAYNTKLTEREREEKLQQLDEEYIKSIKFQSTQKRKLVVEEQIIEESDEPEVKFTRQEEITNSSVIENSNTSKPIETTATTSTVSWTKGSQKMLSKKGNSLVGLVKVKKDAKEAPISTQKVSQSERAEPTLKNDIKPVTNGLSLLGAYSDSENSNSDND